MHKTIQTVFAAALVAAALSSSVLFADSSTPPTREGYTPGTPPESRCAQVQNTHAGTPLVDTEVRTHHRISQNID